ncbi:AAA family ATPase [Dermacoccus nishinomiyaensis]|uniref:AAA family ATPase n=1 Tax=Dermacoccus nishinomiyaensis TaxID=1274 RepID=UPI00248F3AFD|nr:AAA family ATPase [Dermacoccus nishinomiyaensis]
MAAKKSAGLAGLRETMEKRYGTSRVSRRAAVKGYDVIPTGSYSLDYALRTGGWVRGRIHEIVGKEGCSKTTLVINSMANAQRLFPKLAVGYVDMEQAFDWDWAEKNGLDTDDDKFLHVYPDDSEDVSDQIRLMAETGQFSMIVIDSIGGMESKQAFQKDAGDSVVGRNAQVITRMVKHVAVLARQHNVAILIVNQYRANIGSMSMRDESAGPKAAKYATTTKVELARTGETITHKFSDNPSPEVVAKEFRARVTRNKVAAEGKMATYWLITQETPNGGPIGIDQASEALAVGLLNDVIEQQPGGYYSFPWTKTPKDRIRGRDSVLEFLRDNPDRAKEITRLSTEEKSADLRQEPEIELETPEGNIIVDGQEVNPKTGEMVSS